MAYQQIQNNMLFMLLHIIRSTNLLKLIYISMIKRITPTDALMMISALASLIFSEVLWFKGEAQAALFIGLWVPSILAFGIYLKLINQK